MNNTRFLAVKVSQTLSYVTKNGIADLVWKDTMFGNAGGEICGKKFHNQDGMLDL